jgi:hypothetical protein
MYSDWESVVSDYVLHAVKKQFMGTIIAYQPVYITDSIPSEMM